VTVQTEPHHFEIVQTTQRLIEIGPAWTDLWQRTTGNVFQRHDWIMAWWDTIPDRRNRALHIGLAWANDGALHAILPLASNRRRGVRMLEWAAKDYADYADVLVAPEFDPILMPALWGHVWTAGRFDIAYLNRLLPDAKARVLIGSGSDPKRLRLYHRRDASLRVSGPWPTGDAWFQSHTKKTRQKYRRGLSYLGDRGATRSRLINPAEPLAPILECVSALKRQLVKEGATKTTLFDETSTTLACLVEILAALGMLRIFVLECDGMIVAVAINFVQGDTMMAFVTAYDLDYRTGSPGVILMMDYIKWSIDHGLKAIDFLFGEEDFKRRFATERVSLESMVGARTLLGATALAGEKIYRSLGGLSTRARMAGARLKAPKSAESVPTK
jgi:CelD/BcsL family acetyltransferase involved in cellulose biosynthesis